MKPGRIKLQRYIQRLLIARATGDRKAAKRAAKQLAKYHVTRVDVGGQNAAEPSKE